MWKGRQRCLPHEEHVTYKDIVRNALVLYMDLYAKLISLPASRPKFDLGCCLNRRWTSLSKLSLNIGISSQYHTRDVFDNDRSLQSRQTQPYDVIPTAGALIITLRMST